MLILSVTGSIHKHFFFYFDDEDECKDIGAKNDNANDDVNDEHGAKNDNANDDVNDEHNNNRTSEKNKGAGDDERGI